MRISKLKHQDLLKKLNQYDKRIVDTPFSAIPESNDLEEAFNQDIHPESFSNKSILGIDIYQYSNFELKKQTLIPFLFNLIRKEVYDNVSKTNTFLFQKYRGNTKQNERLDKDFIHTGDGGFQMLDTPLHAIALAINYELILRYYNSYKFYPKLRKHIGPLALRYNIATDTIYQYDNNYFGPSIITSARMLSVDRLNRFLLDQNTFEWFMHTMMGVENLQFLSIMDIANFPNFTLYDAKLQGTESIFPPNKDFSFQNIISSDVQKIGEISSKNSRLNIYNLHLQYLGKFLALSENALTITLGNLNLSGIES